MTDNVLEMSDEDFLNAPIPEDMNDGLQEQEVQEETTNEVEEESTEEETVEEPIEPSESTSTQDAYEDTTEASEEPVEAPSEPKVDIDYEAEYKRLLEPFKANGKELKVDNVDDIRQLMQMGANYNKKMAAIKPALKIVKMLENNGLLDESKLSFLIDLDKKNPEAIKKLMKEANIDPLDVDTSVEPNYRPTAYNVSDKEVELDGILDEIKDTESFNTTVDVIGTKWDQASKQVILDNPTLIKVINDHVQTGIYQKISSVVERERMLGRLTGLSDIEAYKTVGDAINAQGGFNTQPMSNPAPTSIKATNVDPKLKDRKKAASSTKSAVSTKANDDFNPLSMSDEEFEKMVSSKFI